MPQTITDSTFDGLAFVVARVRYSSGHYNATIRRDDEAWRARVSYDHAIGPGARNAVRAARAAFDKLRAEHDVFATEEYVAIPGDLDRDTYTFTFVPAYFFTR